jgi:hypothetical protein
MPVRLMASRSPAVEPVDKGWLTEKKIKVRDAVETILERVIGVDGELGGDNQQPRSILNFLLQKVGYRPACVIVTEP